MKVKIGDLTVRQMKAICDIYSSCDGCPLLEFCDHQPWRLNLNKEIDLPDEEVKENE